MSISEIITVDPEIQFGTPVFTGSRVPLQTLFVHLAGGVTMEGFLDDFPTVEKAQAEALLELLGDLLHDPATTRAILQLPIS